MRTTANLDGCWGAGEDRKGPAYPQYPPTGSITVVIPGLNDESPDQDGECPGCGAHVRSNRRLVYCPHCGKPVGCT